ncbi:MAG: ferrochelatase [Alphaproteobacteria bacterium]
MTGKASVDDRGKVAVVLFNLGGPDCKEAIRPFLFNFFTDANIIRLPFFLRYILARFIAYRRSKREAGESYGYLGNKSPLVDNSRQQARLLEDVLNQEQDKDRGIYKCFICMRYWHPMAPQVVREVRDWGAQRIVLLPLYPQYSTTTTYSSLGQWEKAALEAGMKDMPTFMTCCYPENDGFIKASTDHIMACYEQALTDGYKKIRVLFSAHGLPERIIYQGDPYQYQCERSSRRIVKALSDRLDEQYGDQIKELDWQNCYQSRVGPMKWIGPPVQYALERAASDDCAVIIYPHAFTQEHVETLVELDIEYKELAKALGIKGYYRARTVSEHPAFIGGLSEIVLRSLQREGVQAEKQSCSCPEHYSRCCMREA